mmetsp:Transcript_59556/g.158436  ORF Transcript_59556/g.158436 Transcript_59556/m.158436 type:complete len:114 (+) Transcript_59556:2-343(+)
MAPRTAIGRVAWASEPPPRFSRRRSGSKLLTKRTSWTTRLVPRWWSPGNVDDTEAAFPNVMWQWEHSTGWRNYTEHSDRIENAFRCDTSEVRASEGAHQVGKGRPCSHGDLLL